MYDVVTVGSSTVDIFAQTAFSELIKIIDPKKEVDLLSFPSGSKVLVEHIEQTIGGSGTNAGVALSRLGHKVAYVGKIGEDSNGDLIIRELRKEKIDVLASRKKGFSGYSIILETLEHDRTILAYKGVNNDLRYNDVPLKKMKTRWFYFGSMMESSFKTQERLARFARKNNIQILFNPSNYLAQKGHTYLNTILKHTTILTLNKEEASCLSGKEDIKDVLLALHSYGPKIVVITDGKKEINAYAEDILYTCKPPKTKVVDCTGAGDAFSSAFLSGVIQEKEIPECLKMGVVNSSSIIKRYGAKNKLLSKREITKKIKNLKIGVKKKKLSG